MYPYITEERQAILNIAQEFVEKEVKPVALELDKKDEFPLALMRRCGELGFLGTVWPEKFGGLGLDWTTFELIVEEISKECPTLGVAIVAHTCLTGCWVDMVGTDEQKEKFLKSAASGEKIMAFASTEPVGLYNFPEYNTRAVLDGDEWVINGGKIFITNNIVSDLFLVTAVTSPVDMGKMSGISTFMVEKGTPGFEFGNLEHKFAWHGSNTGSLFFKNCRIPKENLIGPLDYALQPTVANLTNELLTFGAINLGMAEGAYQRAFNYARQRVQQGKSLFDAHQVVRHKLAKMAAEIEMLRGLLYTATAVKDAGEIPWIAGRVCKYKGSEIALYCASEAMQIHGGNGVVIDNDVERFFRDAKLNYIGGGDVERCLEDISLFITM